MLNISTPTEKVTEEDMTDLLVQLSIPMILVRDFNAHNPYGEVKK